jgi:hypothetical protein
MLIVFLEVESTCIYLKLSSCMLPMFCFFGEFSQHCNKKIGLVNPTKGFLRIVFLNRHILTKKS